MFRKVQNPQGYSNHFRVIFCPETHRQADQKIVFVREFKELHKIYQVKDNQIRFVSEHTCDFPIDSFHYHEIMSNHFILYVFETKELEKTRKNAKFFEDNQIDWEKNAQIIFRIEYGIRVDKIIKPRYLGLVEAEQAKKYSDQEIINILEKVKPLVGRQLVESINYDRGDLYIAEFGPEFENLNRRVFKLRADFTSTEAYQEKLERDKSKLNESLHDELSFASIIFEINNTESNRNSKWKPFIKVEDKMIIVGLIDLRCKKILSTRFLSIYELLEGIEWLEIIHHAVIIVSKVDYSLSVDFLTLDLTFEFGTKVGLNQELQLLLDEELKAGRNDPFNRTLIVEKPNNGTFTQVKNMRFEIFNLFKGERKVVQRNVIGSCICSGTRKQKGKVVSYQGGEDHIKVEILSPKSNLQESEQESKTNSIDDEQQGTSLELATDLVKGVKTEKLTIQLDQLQQEANVFDLRIKSISVVEETKLLIIFNCKMVLFDMESKKVLSSLDYSKGLPIYPNDTKIQGDLMVCCDPEYGYLSFHKIHPQENGNVNFERLSVIQINKFQKIHSIKKFLDFRKVSDDSFILRLESYIMHSNELITAKPGIISLGFDLSTQKDGDLAITPIYGPRFEADDYTPSYSVLSSYMKGDQIFVTGSYDSIFFLGFKSVFGKKNFGSFSYCSSSA